ncbi:inovirus Gp2 family protein [Ectopseudomonas toyotomiensis]|uniref:Inovirus Gp2 family protein n=1 Tax=Ectopseudomonas toyotomiensis TaxID=554344 RepID=A0AA42LHL2_9GAMM|nr:inovirus Gp2 family protein [Pseudomonas toyotomiensis]MBG0843500.1 inovirus Gp2 family protein [Pseudomonas toyotomiensis]MDH0701314.1 inovirus Gp2 family protein [Pseudomonas toyotomiensis]
MLRHPMNPNLQLHYDDTFEGLPVMVSKGPFVQQYLFRLKETLEQSLQEYPRTLAFRVDLRLPVGIQLPEHAYANEVISRFIASFNAKIKHDRACARKINPRAHDSRVRYVWAREVGWGQRPHYHLLILLNQDAYFTIGRLRSDTSNMISRMEEAWASALSLSVGQVSGLVEIPDNATYRVNRRCLDGISALFYRASYLCKAATKSYGDSHHGFGYSRI